MHKLSIIFSLLLMGALAMAQSATNAGRLFDNGDFAAAQKEYKALLQHNPRNTLYLYRYARCAQQQDDHKTAIEYFNRAGDKYMLKYFYLGESYMHLWYFDQAISAYNTYLQSLTEPNERTTYVQQQIHLAEKQKRYLNRVEQIHVLDSVQLPIDSLLTICHLSSEAGTLSYDSTLGLAYMNQRADRRLWAVHRDSNIVIVSAQRLLNQWSTPDTLPSTINTATKQISPYVLNDGITMYFASNDTDGLGGYDIYITRYNTANEAYTQPQNLGYPYNSSYNEYMMIIDESQHIGYFATDRFSPQGYARIYSFIPAEQKTYWRGIPQDSLIGYAQLQYALSADSTRKVISTEEPVKSDDNHSIETVSFVLNDTLVYTTLEDFHSERARTLFLQWQSLQQQQQVETAQLDGLRQRYSTATDAERKEMTPVILHLEKKQTANMQDATALLKQVRNEEISALSTQ